jgi:hypothetical protein
MDFLINESQLRLILQEQDQNNMSGDMKEMYSFTKNLVEKVKKIYGLNLRLLLTWGASVGGFVIPLSEFIKTGRFNLTEEQQILILAGIACTFFYDNSRTLKLLLKKIKSEGLEEIFKEVLIKSKNLRASFFKFLKSAGVTLNNTMDLIAYSFLIPIITDILGGIMNGGNPEEIAMTIAKRLAASGVIVVSQSVLSEVLRRIIKKIK